MLIVRVCGVRNGLGHSFHSCVGKAVLLVTNPSQTKPAILLQTRVVLIE